MPREPIFPNTPAGKAEFINALDKAAESGMTRENWFSRTYQIDPSTIYKTAARLNVPLSTKRDRRAVLEAQRQDLTPGDVVAYREGITLRTLRDWARRERLRLRNNTKVGHRKWWQRNLNEDPETVFEAALHLRVPAHMAIAGYHLAHAPEQPLCWDLTTRQVVAWSEQDYLDGVATTDPATLDDAELVIGRGEETQLAKWPAPLAPAPGTTLDTAEPPLEREGHWPLHPGDAAVELNDAGVELRVTYLGLDEHGLARVRGASGRRKTIAPSHLFHPEEPALRREVTNRRTGYVPPDQLIDPEE